MVCLKSQRIFVFSVTDVGYKIWSDRSSYLKVDGKDEEG